MYHTPYRVCDNGVEYCTTFKNPLKFCIGYNDEYYYIKGDRSFVKMFLINLNRYAHEIRCPYEPPFAYYKYCRSVLQVIDVILQTFPDAESHKDFIRYFYLNSDSLGKYLHFNMKELGQYVYPNMFLIQSKRGDMPAKWFHTDA